MLKVQAEPKIYGKEEVAIVLDGDRRVGAATLSFIEWMHRRVPKHQLSPEQIALVQWYQEHRANSSTDKDEAWGRSGESLTHLHKAHDH
jgi:hypothetical protein